MNILSDRIPQAGLEFLLSRVLTPRISANDVMWYVRGIYGAKGASEAEWGAVRDRVARTLTRMRAAGLEAQQALYRA